MKHLYLIKVKYLGATDTKGGARIKITSLRHNQSKYLLKDYEFNSNLEQAIDYLHKDLKYTVVATCTLNYRDTEHGILVKEFSELKPEDKVLDKNGNRLY